MLPKREQRKILARGRRRLNSQRTRKMFAFHAAQTSKWKQLAGGARVRSQVSKVWGTTYYIFFILGGKYFVFIVCLKLFSGHNKSWGEQKKLKGTVLECPSWLRAWWGIYYSLVISSLIQAQRTFAHQVVDVFRSTPSAEHINRQQAGSSARGSHSHQRTAQAARVHCRGSVV